MKPVRRSIVENGDIDFFSIKDVHLITMGDCNPRHKTEHVRN